MATARLTPTFPNTVPLLCAAVGLAVASVGCGGGGAPAAEDAARPRIALVMKSLANEFFETMAEGARAHHEAHSDQYDLFVNGTRNESDLAQQVALVEQMAASGSDAIVIAPADSRALAPALARAQAAGIVVVNIDNRLDAEAAAEAGLEAPFVGPDNRDGARRVGEILAARLEPGDQVAIIGGIPTAFNARQRQAGFEDAMNAAGAQIVDVQSGGREQAQANMAAAMLREYPNLRALLCANDNMALGALAARRQSDRNDVPQASANPSARDNAGLVHGRRRSRHAAARARAPGEVWVHGPERPLRQVRRLCRYPLLAPPQPP